MSTSAASKTGTAYPGLDNVGKRNWSYPAVWFLIAYVFLLLLIPPRLMIAQIGNPGRPANLWAIIGFALWCLLTIGGWNRNPHHAIRFAAGLVGVTFVVSYITGHLVGWYQPADIHQFSDELWRLASLEQLNEAMISAGDRGLLSLAGWMGVVMLTAEGLRSWNDLETLTTWLVRFATIVAAVGIFQYFTGVDLAGYIQIPGLSGGGEIETLTRSDLNRVRSTSAHPIELGVIMAAILPAALHRSIHSPRRRAWLSPALIGAAVLMSVSRSAVLVAIVALVVLLIGWPNRWRLRFLIAAPFALVAARVAFPGLLGTIRALFSYFDTDPSVDGRTDDYPFVARAFAESPLFGKGLFTWVPWYYRTIDNQALVLALEVGVFGLIAIATLFAVGGILGLRTRWRAPTAERGDLGLSLAAGLAGIVVSYFTFDTLGFAQASSMTFLLVGMSAASWRLANDPLGVNLPGSLGSPSLEPRVSRPARTRRAIRQGEQMHPRRVSHNAGLPRAPIGRLES